MRISTRLMIGVFVPLIVALVVGLTLAYSYRAAEAAMANGSIVRQIRSSITELNHLVFSYITHQEERPKQQFLAEWDSVAGLIARARFRDPEQQRLLEEIRINTQAMKDSFLKLVSMADAPATAGDEALSKEVRETLGGQLLIHSHRADSSASLLRGLTDKDIRNAQTRAIALVIVVLILATAPLTVMLARTRRAITASLGLLRDGTKVIGSGDLHYRLALPAKDELGELARSVDDMAERLQAVTVSRERLQQEAEERKKAEEAVRESEQRWATTLASIGDAVIATDAEGRITFLNPVARDITGWLKEEATGQPIGSVFRIINEQGGKPGEGIVERVLKDGSVASLENNTALITRGGETIPIEDSAAPIKDRDGNISGAVVVFHDVSRKRREQQAIQESEAKYRTLFESTTDAVHLWKLVHDEDGRIKTWSLVDANPRALITWGKTLDAIKGKTAEEIFGAGATDRFMHVVQKIMSEGVPFGFEEYFPGPDRYFRLTSVPFGDFFFVTGADITELKKGEEAIKRAHDELESRVQERTRELQHTNEVLQTQIEERKRAEVQLRQAQKMEALGTLTGGIAHDFNNILAAIMGFVELAHDEMAPDSKEKRHLDRVMQAILRGRGLVRQMLTFARRTEQEKKPLRLSSVVMESVELLRASLPSTISIQVDNKSESGLVLGDPVQLQQVVMNLCTNAAYAMRERGGSLHIRVSDYSVSPSGGSGGMRPGLYIKLAVTDTGSGIAPEIMDKIFDPFFTTKKTGDGSGLGLSVAHGIVKQSDGYITAESTQGKGATFSVWLPKIAEQSRVDAPYDDVISTGSERILFVDDEEALVEMGEEVLTKLGYTVVSRTGGREALSLLKADPGGFHLVITDQTMPDMTGIELAKEIRAIRPDLPVILCTGFSHLVDARAVKEAGISALAMKPLTRGEVARIVRKVLDG